MADHRRTNDVHKGAYVSATDPALNVANVVLADKLWIDTSGAAYLIKLRNAGNTAWVNVTFSGAGDALVANPLSQFAATTSAQLAGVISDESGTGALVFAGSPALTGNPTAPTQAAADNTTKLATTAFVSTAIANLIASSPATLDTLNELAAALGNDPNFATTLTTSLGLKASTTLNNLGTTNINAALLFQTGLDIGSTLKPARHAYLHGSGVYATGSLQLTGTPTGNRVITFPDATIVVSGSAAALTSGRVPFVTTGGLLTDNSLLQWNGTTLIAGNVKAGQGVATNTEKFMVNTPSGVQAGMQFFQDGVESWTIFNPASATELRFSASGNERVRITSAGLVGINATSLTARFTVISNSAAEVVIVARGTAAQSANLMEWQNSSGTILARITQLGYATFGESGGADAGSILLVRGNTKGMRIGTTAGWSLIEGVDQTGSASYQPIKFGGSTVAFHLSNVDTFTFNAAGLSTHIGSTLSTAVDGTVGSSIFNFTVTKNDANVRTFAGVQIKPTLNAGASNLNTTLDILQIDTVNTNVTGLTINLIDAMYGGASVFSVNSSGNIIANRLTIPNNESLYAKDAGGTARRFWLLSATSDIQVGAIDSGWGTGGLILKAPSYMQFVVNQGVSTITGGFFLANGHLILGGGSTDLAELTLVNRSAAVVVQVIRGAASQSANLQEWQNSAGTVLANVSSAGLLTINNTADAATAILIKGATNGFRMGTGGGFSQLEGVDSTGVASYQPLRIGGSTTALTSSATIVLIVNSTSEIEIANGANIKLNATTGTKIGTATSQKLGFWNVTPIIQPASANQAAITDSTGGTAGFTLVDAGAAYSQANVNNNFASLNRQLDAIRTALVNSGIMKGAA